MTWSPSNNQYDGINSSVVNDVELNAPYYKWDLHFELLQPITIYPPMLSMVVGSYDPDDPDQERTHCLRVMVVPPESGRCC